MWGGIQQLSNHEGNQVPSVANKTRLVEELNRFFAHFEISRAEDRVAPALSATDHPLIPQTHKDNPLLCECQETWMARWDSREGDQGLGLNRLYPRSQTVSVGLVHFSLAS